MRLNRAEVNFRPGGQLFGGNVSEEVLHLRERGLRIDVAHNNQDGVVGGVPLIVKILKQRRRRLVERRPCAQAGIGQRRALIHSRKHLGVKHALGFGLGFATIASDEWGATWVNVSMPSVSG